MGFLKPEHEDLKRLTRHFTNKEVVPIADALDREEAEIPTPLLEKMAEMGFFGLLVPKDYGGLGLDTLSLCVVTEELARGWLSVGSVIARNVLCGHILYKAGTEEQRRRFLPGMATGMRQTASAGTEPEAGSDASNIKTTARRRDGHYVVIANAGNRDAVATALAEREASVPPPAPPTPSEPGADVYFGFVAGAAGFRVEDVSDDLALIAVQGPASVAILAATEGLDEFAPSLGDLGYYAAAAARFDGAPVFVARTGYTGEDGFELAVPVPSICIGSSGDSPGAAMTALT